MDTDDEKQVETGLNNSAAIKDVFDFLAEKGSLEFFMYALPGEPHAKLTNDVWLGLAKSASTLRGAYVELAPEHWVKCPPTPELQSH